MRCKVSRERWGEACERAAVGVAWNDDGGTACRGIPGADVIAAEDGSCPGSERVWHIAICDEERVVAPGFYAERW